MALIGKKILGTIESIVGYSERSTEKIWKYKVKGNEMWIWLDDNYAARSTIANSKRTNKRVVIFV